MRMRASNLLHRKGGRSSSAGNSCCPIIRVKCTRPHKQHTHPEAAMSLSERLAKYKKAKAVFKRAILRY